MTLIRGLYKEEGIFGALVNDNGTELLFTLEHAYIQQDLSFLPKTPEGQYLCVRGTHQLKHGGPFETFEVTNVPGHTGILFHPGNFNNDSDGCILLGLTKTDAGVLHSRDAFAQFMKSKQDLDSFTLTITKGVLP